MGGKVSCQPGVANDLATIVDSVCNRQGPAKRAQVYHPSVGPDEGMHSWQPGSLVHNGVCERLSHRLAALINKESATVCATQRAQILLHSILPNKRPHLCWHGKVHAEVAKVKRVRR